MEYRIKFLIVFITILTLQFCSTAPLEKKYPFKISEAIDSLNGVKVFYNGETDNVTEVNFSSDKYLLGLKYQCVEFVKRYYYEYYKHKMPNVYGNAKDFFKTGLLDGEINTDRDLIQYSNPSSTKPQVGDLIVLSGTETNPYGHVAIISNVFENGIEIIQQNAGPFDPSREKYKLNYSNSKCEIMNKRILGWLRKSH